MFTDRAAPRFSQTVWTLFLVQLSNWRWSWPQMVITGMLAPLGSLAGLGLFARSGGPEALRYVLAGAVTMALLFETQNKVASNFAFMRTTGAFDFFASLPVRREALILATMAAFLLLALPSVVCISVLGILVLDVDASPSLLLLPVVILVVLPFAGLGAWIGTRSRSETEGNSLSLGATVLMVALGPVLIPAALLPDFLVWLGYLNPATYASSLLRQAFVGTFTARAWLDLAVLTLLSAAVWALTRYRMPWRST